MMRSRRKWVLAGLLLLFLAGVFASQRAINQERRELGFTRIQPLENAPPILAFTTVALGGFRGLISNALWIRLVTLQEEGKYYEMVQLADWITALEPHYAQVWRYQAWNMAYNVSVKFKEPEDRWRWVQRGIELLRDKGLQYNPDEPQLYYELAWHFQHKMGDNMDEAHFHYKGAWMQQMTEVFGWDEPDLDGLGQPQSERDHLRRRQLMERYKMDPDRLLAVEREYGPLEWRLPEAHAIYWAVQGLEKAVRPEDKLPLRRVIYNSMNMMFTRGKLVLLTRQPPPPGEVLQVLRDFRLKPDVNSFARVNAAYLKMMEAEPGNVEKMQSGHRNFLKDSVMLLFVFNNPRAAETWYDYLKREYPREEFKGKTMPEFVMERFQELAGGRTQNKVSSLIEGLLVTYFEHLALDDEETAEGHYHLARLIHENYQTLTKSQEKRVTIGSFDQMRKTVLDQLMNPETGLPPLLRERLRARLSLPAP